MKALFLLVFLAFPAAAEQVCQSVYDPLNDKWVYACVERERGELPAPRCRQEYDPMNGVWVTVCE